MNNETVGHNFVYGDNGKGSNFESSNGTLYSYSSILAIKKNGLILISENIANYSSSSGRHSLHLNRAIGWNTPTRDQTINIYLEDIRDFFNPTYKKGSVINEVVYTIDTIKDLLLKQKKARVRSYFDQIERIINNTNKLIKYFGIDKRSSVYKRYLNYSNIEDLKLNYVDLIEQYEKDKIKAKKAAINKAAKKVYEKIQNFTGMNDQEMKKYSKKDLATYDFLRVDEDQLCTSQNLCVDLKQAKILYLLMINNKDIIGKKIGHYTILSHNEIYVKIGCHNILVQELKRILS